MWQDYINYFRDNPKGYWFKAKLYGWGWVPVTWQGWGVLAVFIFALLLNSLQVSKDNPSTVRLASFFTVEIILVGLLLVICFLKGESPHWQWGPPHKKTPYKS